MSVNFSSLVLTAGPGEPSFAKRQVTLTQTITYPDATTTAVVTLDRGSPPTSTPAPSWSGGAASSDGLQQEQIGIIVGCLVGAAVVGIILWCCCTRRCGCTRYSVYDNPNASVEYFYTPPAVTQPRSTYWPAFPRSIPPPPTPTYVATDTGPRYTAYRAANWTTPTYYGG
ncbi:hypothetical protein F4819DRAFT_465661 [Hypoxylon fuscum]|nr:hypothetical protein F4819DRAFT_465661 [Hypoxylon fuscum]